jgi:calcineurin-like phosphoesterase family protein
MTRQHIGRTIRTAAACALAILLCAARPASAAKSACEWEGVERIVAIGDVHGAYDRFVEILKVARLVDEDERWIGGATHLVQLGDVVDRGDGSRKVLDLLRRLERDAQTAGGMVHLLLGNHEAARMLGDLQFATDGEYEAFASPNSEKVRRDYLRTLGAQGAREHAAQKTPLGLVEMRLAFGRDGEYGRLLRQLPVTIKINGIEFAHGGISPSVAGMGCDKINEQVRRELTGDLDRTRAQPLSSLTARADGPLWYRGLAQQPETFAPQMDEILAKLRARAIVVGHTVAATGRITTRFDGRVIQIDTGMQPAYVQNGRASALEIKGGEATAIYVDRRDPVHIARGSGGS